MQNKLCIRSWTKIILRNLLKISIIGCFATSS